MPPPSKLKKRKRSEFQGPDDPTLRRAPGFEHTERPTTPKPGVVLEKHTDYFRTSAGMSSATTLVQGPFSPDKRERAHPQPDFDLTPLTPPNFDTDNIFSGLGDDYQTEHNGPAYLARENLPKKHLIEEHLWASDIEDTDDEAVDGARDGQAKAKGTEKARRKQVPSVSRILMSIFLERT